jgi:DNA-binding CsgD family transcriptional regulator
MEYTYIYSLSDPNTHEIRYIGKSNNIVKRLHCHLTKSNLVKNTHKNNWIKQLLLSGSKPILEVIDIVPIEDWMFWEIYWISQFKTWGFDLTNLTNGGDAVKNVIRFGSDNTNYNYNVNDDKILALINEGISQKEIALRLKTNLALIKRRMVKYNINFCKNRGIRITNGQTHNFRIDITKEKILKLIDEGLSVNKISKILKTDSSTIKNRIKN